ncbi:MAG: hypothetical protein LUD77_10370 [Clostridiales bacterium]|nr:hypothetical protein [Clostridiales bacterium]
MTRTERNEYNYFRKQINDLGASNTCMMSIRTNAGSEYKKALHELFTECGFHSCEVKTDPIRFDDNERIFYIKGIDHEHWTNLYTEEEKELFARKLN